MDKEREASQGFDGAWIAHPGLVVPVHEVFQQAFHGDNRLSYVPEVKVTADDLLQIPSGEVTEGGVRNNISTALQYIDAWTQGYGAVAINGLMEDVATAEISRAQLWQWVRHGTGLSSGRRTTEDLYLEYRAGAVSELLEQRKGSGPGALDKAVELLDSLVTAPTFTEFLTIPGLRYLD